MTFKEISPTKKVCTNRVKKSQKYEEAHRLFPQKWISLGNISGKFKLTIIQNKNYRKVASRRWCPNFEITLRFWKDCEDKPTREPSFSTKREGNTPHS